MRDGRTRQLSRREEAAGIHQFLERNRAALVVLSGGAAGTEHELDAESMRLGRGASVEIRFEDAAMSHEHAAVELTEDGFRVRDLGSTNGVRVNGSPVLAADLKHGDRIELGTHVLQLVIETRSAGPRTYVLADD